MPPARGPCMSMSINMHRTDLLVYCITLVYFTSRWKYAEPFWSTAATHGRKVAFFNWHDCQLPGATVESPGGSLKYFLFCADQAWFDPSCLTIQFNGVEPPWGTFLRSHISKIETESQTEEKNPSIQQTLNPWPLDHEACTLPLCCSNCCPSPRDNNLGWICLKNVLSTLDAIYNRASWLVDTCHVT